MSIKIPKAIDKKKSDGMYEINNKINRYDKHNFGCANTVMVLKQYSQNQEILSNTKNLANLMVQYAGLDKRDEFKHGYENYCKEYPNSQNYEGYISHVLSGDTTYFPNQRFILQKEYQNAYTSDKLIDNAIDYFTRNYDYETSKVIINTFKCKYGANNSDSIVMDELGQALGRESLAKKTMAKYIRLTIYMFDQFFHDREKNKEYSPYMGYVFEQLEKQGDLDEY